MSGRRGRPGEPISCLVVFGTRPEGIKMAPVVSALRNDAAFRVKVAVTGQHREMLDQALSAFDLRPDYDFALMRPDQSPGDIVRGVLERLPAALERERPHVVLVHGDTVSSVAAALAAFFHKIPVGHVEAGLRTPDRYDPFPEEMDRRLTGVLANLHFAPTARARENLLRENVDPACVYVTGNTVIDALLQTVKPDYRFADPTLRRVAGSGRRLVLVTTHRRENLGEPLKRVYRALIRLAEAFADAEVVFAVHPNPAVRELAQAMLAGRERITLVDPPEYREFVHLMARCELVLTDSGGLQEEAPALGKPVLVLRETTERPEGVEAGACLRVGTDEEAVYREAARLLSDRGAYARMAKAVNPYGDGKASERIVEALRHWFGLGERPADFLPERL